MMLVVCTDCNRILETKTVLREDKISSDIFLKDGKVVSDGKVFFEVTKEEVTYSRCDPCKKKL